MICSVLWPPTVDQLLWKKVMDPHRRVTSMKGRKLQVHFRQGYNPYQRCWYTITIYHIFSQSEQFCGWLEQSRGRYIQVSAMSIQKSKCKSVQCQGIQTVWSPKSSHTGCNWISSQTKKHVTREILAILNHLHSLHINLGFFSVIY